MMNMHHKPLKKFGLDGMIHSDSAIMRLKEEYIRLIKLEMQLLGYVPRLDIDPDFTIEYNKEKRYFEFELTLYGIYVGKKKAEWIMGIDGTKVVPIQSSKLKEFLSAAV
jgi:hypothetical protein